MSRAVIKSYDTLAPQLLYPIYGTLKSGSENYCIYYGSTSKYIGRHMLRFVNHPLDDHNYQIIIRPQCNHGNNILCSAILSLNVSLVQFVLPYCKIILFLINISDVRRFYKKMYKPNSVCYMLSNLKYISIVNQYLCASLI